MPVARTVHGTRKSQTPGHLHPFCDDYAQVKSRGKGFFRTLARRLRAKRLGVAGSIAHATGVGLPVVKMQFVLHVMPPASTDRHNRGPHNFCHQHTCPQCLP